MDIQEKLRKIEALKAEKLENGAKKTLNSLFSTMPIEAKKAEGGGMAKKIAIEVVANVPLFLDSDGDVVMPNAFEFEGYQYPQLDTHDRSTIASLIAWGKFSYRDIPKSELGIVEDSSTQALIFNSVITPEQHPIAFNKYKTGLIRQHSIAFYYREFDYACNKEGEEYSEYKKVWDEVYPQLLNKELADKRGEFWAVRKGEITELSSCVFGASKVTVTLSVTEKTEEQQETESKKTLFTYKN